MFDFLTSGRLDALNDVQDGGDEHKEGADRHSHRDPAVADVQRSDLTCPAGGGHAVAVVDQHAEERCDDDLEQDVQNLLHTGGELLDEQINTDQAGAAHCDVAAEEDQPCEGDQCNVLCPVQRMANGTHQRRNKDEDRNACNQDQSDQLFQLTDFFIKFLHRKSSLFTIPPAQRAAMQEDIYVTVDPAF